MVWAFGETENAGPVTWVHENYRCPNCEIEFEDACCKNIPQGNFCVPDADTFEEDAKVDSKYVLLVANGLEVFLALMNKHFLVKLVSIMTSMSLMMVTLWDVLV